MKRHRILYATIAVASVMLFGATADASIVAYWDFESIGGSAATNGQAMNGSYFDDTSGNGNHLYAYSGSGYTAAANVFGNTTLSADKTTSWDGLRTDDGNTASGDLLLSGSPVGSMAQWTISADVNFASTDIGQWRTIVGMDGIGGGGK